MLEMEISLSQHNSITRIGFEQFFPGSHSIYHLSRLVLSSQLFDFDMGISLG